VTSSQEGLILLALYACVLSYFASQTMNIVSVCFTHLHFNPVFRMHALMSRQTEDLVFDFNCNTHIYGYTLQILPL